jgi:hypothetical protein
MCTTIEIYNKHKLKLGVNLVFDEPNLKIQTLSYAQLFKPFSLNGQ